MNAIMTMILLLISLPILITMSTVRVEKVDILKLSEDEQDQLLRKRPALYTRVNLLKSFQSYSSEMLELIRWWGENQKRLVDSTDKAIVLMVCEHSAQTLKKSIRKVHMNPLPVIWFFRRKYSHNDYVKRFYGKEILRLYVDMYTLKMAKDRLENPEVPSANELVTAFRKYGLFAHAFFNNKPIFNEKTEEAVKAYTKKLINTFQLQDVIA